MDGPIIKDAVYYGFWTKAVAAMVVANLLASLANLGILYLILRELRKR